MAKTEVYSWRVALAVKSRLEDAAQRERRSVADLLDEIVTEHLNARDGGDDPDQQQRLHARAARFAGSISGTDPNRSATVRERVRTRLRSRVSNAR